MPTTKTRLADPVTDYARAVVDGKSAVGELVRLACERHLRDIEHGHERGLYWDPDSAQTIIDFFGLLRHSKGRWAGKPFVLEPWQKFFVGCIWGWKRADGTRRFRLALLEVARKNGKSTLSAGIALALLLLDGEAGAEVYCCATKRDQAKITHSEAERMVASSPALRKRIKTFKNNLSIEKTNSKLEPLGADSDTLDGLNVSGAICDELHAWPKRHLWDVIDTATGARDQPLRLATTTAGYNRNSIWWEVRQLVIKVLRGLTEDDSVFGLIYTLDDGDDWPDEKNWAKSNPNLGVTVKVEDLRDECKQALATPGKQPAFRRLKLNQPTEAASVWIDLRRWDACAGIVNESELEGRTCFCGLDLSSNRDLTSAVYIFPPDDPDDESEPWILLPRFWLPSDDLTERCQADGVAYDQWVEEGLIELIDGPIIRYEFVEAKILEDAERFRISEVAVDRWLAVQTAKRLEDEGLDVIGFGQGFASMAGPVKEFERLVEGRRFLHSGHAVLRLCVANTAVRQDPAGNRKPDKSKSTGRIDGVVAALMALGRATSDETASVYDRGDSLEL